MMTPEQQQRWDELMATKMSRWPKGLVRYMEELQHDLGSLSADDLATGVEEWISTDEPS
jgi:hypothetical protein